MDGGIFSERQRKKGRNKKAKRKYRWKLIRLLAGSKRKWKCLRRNSMKQTGKIRNSRIIK
jgi:hypothetical protein